MTARVLRVLVLMSAMSFGTAAIARGQATPPARAATPPRAGARPPAAAAQRRDSTDSLAMAVDYRREVFNYQGAARDPFGSLLNENSSSSSVHDLRLVGVIYDPRGGSSMATIRDKNNPRPFRVRRGDTIGRLRVIQIREREVVFQLEEFGFERQEILALTRPEVTP